MNLSLFDLVTASNIVAYWIEKNVNRQPMLGETLFPVKKEIGIKLDWIKGANNQPVALRLSAYDSKAIRRDREGIEQYTTKMPFFKESMYIDEEMRQSLNTLLQTSNKALINTIVAKIFDDQIKLIAAARISLERMRMELLQSGTITLASNGQAFNYDFGIPAAQKKSATQLADAKAWSNPAADIVADVNEIKDYMRGQGVDITKAIINSSVVKNIVKNTNIKNSIYVLAGGSIASVSSARALSYLQEETGVVFYVYDNVYVNEQGQTVKYFADDTVAFLPDGTLGNTHLGTTPEESDLMNKGGVQVSIVDTGIAVTTYKMDDPVNVEMKVSMVGLPSFERANEVYILDTAN